MAATGQIRSQFMRRRVPCRQGAGVNLSARTGPGLPFPEHDRTKPAPWQGIRSWARVVAPRTSTPQNPVSLLVVAGGTRRGCHHVAAQRLRPDRRRGPAFRGGGYRLPPAPGTPPRGGKAVRDHRSVPATGSPVGSAGQLVLLDRPVQISRSQPVHLQGQPEILVGLADPFHPVPAACVVSVAY